MEAGAKQGQLVGSSEALHAGNYLASGRVLQSAHHRCSWLTPPSSLSLPLLPGASACCSLAAPLHRRPPTPPAAMSKRGGHGAPPTRPDYTAAEPAGPPPSTSKGALEGATSWVPAPLQPAAMLAVGELRHKAHGARAAGCRQPLPPQHASSAPCPAALSLPQPTFLLAGMAKAAWTLAVPLARFAYRLIVWSSPVLIW